jgi:hypothetical protein
MSRSHLLASVYHVVAKGAVIILRAVTGKEAETSGLVVMTKLRIAIVYVGSCATDLGLCAIGELASMATEKAWAEVSPDWRNMIIVGWLGRIINEFVA